MTILVGAEKDGRVVMRIGLVGVGAVGRRHATVINGRAGRCALVAVADPDTPAAEAVAAPSGARVYDSARSLLAAGEADALVLATPNAAHHAGVTVAAEEGVHVLVEKPLAETVAECDAMVAMAEHAGITLTVGHVQRFVPQVVRARALLDAGVIGRTRLVKEYRSSRYEPGTRATWFLDSVSCPGGIVTNLGAHCVDKLAYLIGGGFVVRHAWADGSTVPSEVVALLENDAGVQVNLTLIGTGMPSAEVTEVIGTEGALRLSADGIMVYRRGEMVDHEPPPADRLGSAFTNQLDAFVDAVRTGSTSAADGHYGRAIVEVLAAVLAGGSAGQATGGSGNPS